MKGVNRVILVGNLGKEPEIRTLENGIKVAKFSMATNEKYLSRTGEKMIRTEWHQAVLWRGLAENAERLLKKGNLIYLEGKLRSSSYADKEGNIKYVTEVEGENFTLLSRPEGEYVTADKAEVMEVVAEYNPGSEDLPF
jgi:single-strand DNA-binding protein